MDKAELMRLWQGLTPGQGLALIAGAIVLVGMTGLLRWW